MVNGKSFCFDDKFGLSFLLILLIFKDETTVRRFERGGYFLFRFTTEVVLWSIRDYFQRASRLCVEGLCG